MREFELISEERENRALRDIKFSKNCSGREVSQPVNESLASLRMFPSDNTVEIISTPVGKLEKNDGFTNHGSCLMGKGGYFVGKTDSVIEVDDDVHETTISCIRNSYSNMKDQKGEYNNVEERHCNPMIKDIKFNISKDQISSVSPRINGTFDCTSTFQFQKCSSRFGDCSKLNAGAGGTNQNLRRWSKQGDRKEATSTLGGGSVSGKNDLIAVGPDGKGGRIKILRSKPQLSVSILLPLYLLNLKILVSLCYFGHVEISITKSHFHSFF